MWSSGLRIAGSVAPAPCRGACRRLTLSSSPAARSVLVFSVLWPESDSSAAGLRTNTVLGAFLDRGYNVGVAATGKAASNYRNKLEAGGVATHHITLNDDTARHLLADIRPDVVIFDQFITEEQFGWVVREVLPEAIRVVDTQDLHFLRLAREDVVKRSGSGGQLDLEREVQHVPLSLSACGNVILRELAAIHRSDLTMLVSSWEKELLLRYNLVDESKLMVSSFAYDESKDGLPSRDFASRQNFVSIGNFRHKPNMDGCKWLVSTIWPRIRSKVPPGTELHLLGAYPPSTSPTLHQPEHGVRLIGKVKDSVSALGDYRVSLAPLRYGAGIKGKIADSWRAWTPAVTTCIGAEGMFPLEGRGHVVANEPEAFSAAAADVYTDATLWKGESEWAGARCREMFSSVTKRRLVQQVEDALATLCARRDRDVMGQMGWYANNRYSEFFSKYLALKQKDKREQASKS